MPIHRKMFSGGWNPSADAVNCPDNALLRMDNCILDQEGCISVRAGMSAAIYTLASTAAVHSLYTAYIGTTKYRMIGCDASGGGDNVGKVFANGSSIATAVNGTSNTDIAFGSHMGEILFARGTTKKKYDGTNTYAWGIAAPSAPTMVASQGPLATFATCASTEAPDAMIQLEGTQSFAANHSGTANGAVSILGDSTTFRGSSTLTYTAASKNFAIASALYSDNTYVPTDFDAIQMWVYLTEPSLVKNVALLFDHNDGTFTLDYSVFTWSGDTETEVTVTEDVTFQSTRSVTKYSGDVPGGNTYGVDPSSIEDAQENIQTRTVRYSVFRPQAAGWNYMSIPRGAFQRVGSTAGKGWNTVKAVRVFFDGTAQTTVRFDTIQTVGGLHGDYDYRIAYVREHGGGPGGSASDNPWIGISPLSGAITASGDNMTATPSWSASGDAQVTHVYVYRMGGTMDGFYRVARIAVGTTTYADTRSDASVLLDNLPAITDAIVPPDGIIGIEGPYYQRTLCLAWAPGASSGNATHVYWSEILNPDTFRFGAAARLGDGTEAGYWIKKAYGGVYIGTSKDIYRLDGTLAELPDGTYDIRLTALNMAYPPVSKAIAVEGNYIVYLASDGWRIFTGQDSQQFRGNTELLWRGYARHSIPGDTAIGPIAISSAGETASSARFRAAISNGFLLAMTPEGNQTTTTLTMYRYHFEDKQWNRFVYGGASGGFWTIYREPDGTLLVGDNAGHVYQVEVATANDDAGSGIAVTVISKIDNGGNDLMRKEPWDFFIRADTGNVAAGVAFYLDGSGTQATNVSPQLNGEGIYEIGIVGAGSMTTFRQIQTAITLTATAGFRLMEYAHRYRELPETIHYLENKPASPSVNRKRFGGFKLLIDTHNSALTLTPVLDGVDQSTTTVTNNGPLWFNYKFTSSTIGRDLWLKMGLSAGTVPFEYYKYEPIVEQEFPEQISFYENRPITAAPNRKRFGGLSINLDTLGNTITVTPVLDGVDQSTFTASTTINIPVTQNLKFTSAILGRDLWYRLSGGAFEHYGGNAIVEQELPPQVAYYENRPKIASANRRRFSGVTLQIDTLGNTATVTPVLDGADQTPITVSTTAGIPLTKNLTFAEVVGKDLWVRITATAFELYGEAQPVIVGDLPPLVRATPPTDMGYPCEKVITGINTRLTTPGGATTLTFYGDGASLGTSSVTTTSTSDPELSAFQLSTPAAYKEFYMTASQDIELYEFKPMVLYKNPCYRTSWDTGYININPDEYAWVRKIRVKAKSTVNISLNVYMDGTSGALQGAPAAATKTITVLSGKVSVYEVHLGRECKGPVPRVVLTVAPGASFQPYWVEIWYRGSGDGNIQKKRIAVTEKD